MIHSSFDRRHKPAAKAGTRIVAVPDSAPPYASGGTRSIQGSLPMWGGKPFFRGYENLGCTNGVFRLHRNMCNRSAVRERRQRLPVPEPHAWNPYTKWKRTALWYREKMRKRLDNADACELVEVLVRRHCPPRIVCRLEDVEEHDSLTTEGAKQSALTV